MIIALSRFNNGEHPLFEADPPQEKFGSLWYLGDDNKTPDVAGKLVLASAPINQHPVFPGPFAPEIGVTSENVVASPVTRENW